VRTLQNSKMFHVEHFVQVILYVHKLPCLTPATSYGAAEGWPVAATPMPLNG
jgi:hypothetical protein